MKTYYARFGSGDPRDFGGLSPTFLIFSQNGTPVTPPAIGAVAGATGFYSFQYGTTTPIVFLLDGATTGLDASVRYVSGAIDPVDRADEYGNTLIAFGQTLTAYSSTLTAYSSTLTGFGESNYALGTTAVALGTSNLALGNTILGSLGGGDTLSAEILLRIGSTSSTFGTTSVDPGDLFGYMKRAQEFLEGDQTFNKTSGAWAISTRGGTLLVEKSLSQTSTQVSRS